MGHSNSLKNVPNVNSKEFEKFLEDNGLDKNIFSEDFANNLVDDSVLNQPKKKSIGKILFKSIDNWCIKNPKLSMAVVLGGSAFICYKMSINILSQAVFKGNLKTSRYFNKHSS